MTTETLHPVKPADAGPAPAAAPTPAPSAPQVSDDADELVAENERSTNFIFDHKVFKIEGCYFAIIKYTKEPGLIVPMGGAQGSIPLAQLPREFGIDKDSADAKLLEVVEKGLRYVKEIRPYDSIPRELLDGTASWSVDEHHRRRARARLVLNALACVSGKEPIAADANRVNQFADDPSLEDRLKWAAGEMTGLLALSKNQASMVIERFESVGRELAYIESLRERVRLVHGIGEHLKRGASLFRRDPELQQEITRMQALMTGPLKMFDDTFELLDRQVADMTGTLGDSRTRIKAIRDNRDEIHFRMMLWDELIDQWKEPKLARDDQSIKMLKSTYRFLAVNFTETKPWPMFKPGKAAGPGTEAIAAPTAA